MSVPAAPRPAPWTGATARTSFVAAIHIAALIVGGLWLDAALGWTGQHLATIWTFAVWAWLFRRGGTVERRVLILCTAIAGTGEIFLSLVWGLYDYQFGNVPLFVPPGHALLMTLGLLIVRRLPPLVVRAVVPTVSLAAIGWGAFVWIGNTDRFGVVLALLYLACLAWGRDRALYAVMFVLALVMEIYGTLLGNWRWQAMTPWLGWSAANPPFSAGAFYCALDLLVLAALSYWRGNVAASAPFGLQETGR